MPQDQLKAPAQFAFAAGRELGWRDKWMARARNAKDYNTRKLYAGFARTCNHEYIRLLKHALECQPRFYVS